MRATLTIMALLLASAALAATNAPCRIDPIPLPVLTVPDAYPVTNAPVYRTSADVRRLARAGAVCRVFGHWWEYHVSKDG